MHEKIANKKTILAAILLAATLVSMMMFTPAKAGVGPFTDRGPRTDQLLMIPYTSPEAAYAALKKGDIEIFDWALTKAQKDEAMTDPNINVAPVEESGIRELDLNNNETISEYPGKPSPMGYPSFRQAVAHCVDKDYIVNIICEGEADRIDVPIPKLGGGYHNPNCTGAMYPYPYDLNAARAKLVADGFVQGTSAPLVSGGDNVRVHPSYFWKHDNPHVGTDIIWNGTAYEWTITNPVSGMMNVSGVPAGSSRYVRLNTPADWTFDPVSNNITVTVQLEICTFLMIEYQSPNPYVGEDLDPIVFYARIDDPWRYGASEHLRDNLLQVGIPVDFRPGDSSFCHDPVMEDLNFHIYSGGWGLGRYPTYLYYLFHTDFWAPGWYNYLNPPCLRPGRGISYEPNSDVILEESYYATTMAAFKKAVQEWQCECYMPRCINIALFSSRGFYGYRNLLGAVNLVGSGPNNELTLLNAYRADGGQKLRVGTNQLPKALNILESQWTYEYVILDRMYHGGISVNPYDLTIDQPWILQDWEQGLWYDPQDGENKTKVTYWLRKDAWFQTPVTGAPDGEVTTQDVLFTASYVGGLPGAWPYSGYKDIHHMNVVDEHTYEVYYDSESMWHVYAATGYPYLPKHIWLQSPLATYQTETFKEGVNFTDASVVDTTKPMVLGHGLKWCTITHGGDTIEVFGNLTAKVNGVWKDCWPLVPCNPPPEKPITAILQGAGSPEGFQLWMDFSALGVTLNPGDTFTVGYWGTGDDTGVTPGSLPWDEIYTSCGQWFMVDVGPTFPEGPFLYNACRTWIWDPLLGEVDWRWKWGPRDGTRGFVEVVPKNDTCCIEVVHAGPRTGFFKIDIYDVVTVAGAYGSQGRYLPSPHWNVGADLAPPECQIDIYDIVTCTGRYGSTFGEPPLDP
jgi:ABC-type transport system substrate-binding protein